MSKQNSKRYGSKNKKQGSRAESKFTQKDKPSSDCEARGIGIICQGKHKDINDVNISANDPSWYMDPHGVTEDSARIATYLPNGKAWFDTDINGTTTIGDPVSCIVGYVPCPAVSTGDSAISIAAQVVLQQIKKVLNKPVLNYQAADPIMAYIAFLNIVVQTNEIHRDYALMNSYSTENLAYPKGVLNALGYSDDAIEDLRANMARYRQMFNTTLYKISSIFMPFENNILEKYKWMSSGLWLDHDNTKAQVYGYATEGYYVFSDVASDQGSSCVFKPFDRAHRILKADLMNVKITHLNECVDALRNSDSWNQMVSDMQRAFPDAQTYSFPLIEENETPNIGYNYDMLQQFQNVHTTPLVKLDDAGTSLNITQDVNANTVISQPVMQIGQASFASQFAAYATARFNKGELYNFDKLNPQPTEIIENTAATTLWTVSGNSIGCADNDFTHAIYVGFYVTYPFKNKGTFGYVTKAMASVYAHTLGEVEVMAAFTKMDYAPMVNIIYKLGDTTRTMLYPMGETDNLVQVPQITLKRLFLAETLALWNVPNNVVLGKIN